MKKKIVITLIGAAVLAGLILFALPYGKVYGIMAAVQSRDRERLARDVDFPQLRAALKEQLRAAAASSGRTDDFEKIRQALLGQVMVSAVDQLVTPEGLTDFFSKNMAALLGDSDLQTGVMLFLAVIRQGHGIYVTSSEFTMTFGDREDPSVRLTLRRIALDWRLTRIDIRGLAGKIK